MHEVIKFFDFFEVAISSSLIFIFVVYFFLNYSKYKHHSIKYLFIDNLIQFILAMVGVIYIAVMHVENFDPKNIEVFILFLTTFFVKFISHFLLLKFFIIKILRHLIAFMCFEFIIFIVIYFENFNGNILETLSLIIFIFPVLTSILISVICILYLKTIATNKSNFLNNEYFWICTGLIIYNIPPIFEYSDNSELKNDFDKIILAILTIIHFVCGVFYIYFILKALKIIRNKR